MALLSGGCSPERVDCEAVCSRMFRKCPAAVIRVHRALRPEQQKRLAGAGLKAFSRLGYATCTRACTARSGRGSDASAINQCLKKQTCEAFARCMAPHLR